MKHPIVHIELSAQDRHEAARFYRDVFGWESQDFPEMNYTTFSTGEGVGGGFSPCQENMPAGTVTIYVHTDDIEETLAKVEALGGQTVSPGFEVPGVGWIAMFRDPTGNMLALLKPATQGM